jgi:hypothetical protein
MTEMQRIEVIFDIIALPDFIHQFHLGYNRCQNTLIPNAIQHQVTEFLTVSPIDNLTSHTMR